MGTRHLIAVQIDGGYKVAQYGQWDGYPSGQGVSVLAFLRSMERASFLQKVRAAKFATPEEIKALWVECGADPNSDLVGMAVSANFKARFPHLSRDAGAKVLTYIANSDPGINLGDQIAFAVDSLFCEYAYVIDFDRETFEVFKGFNKTPLAEGERFYGATTTDKYASNEYEPVRLLKSYSLAALPTDEQFLRDLEPTEDEEG